MVSTTLHRAMVSALVATALIVSACGGAAPAAPTTAPKPTTAPAAASPAASPAAASSAAAASASPAASPSPAALGPNVNGEVDTVNGRLLSVATNTGPRNVRVADTAMIFIEGQGAATDLTPGRMAAITGKPDGTAVVVRLFLPGVTLKPTQFPMGGAQAGNIMTNATIDAFDGKTLTVDLGGQKQAITVAPETQIVKPVPSNFDQIKPGVRVTATGTPEGEVLTATSVTIITQPNVTRAN